MAKPTFQFTLQPELLSREAERERVEKEAARLREEAQREQRELEARLARLCTTRERKDGEVARQFAPLEAGQSSDEWIARAAFVDELRALEQRQLEALDEQDRVLRLAEHKLRAKQSQLAELVARVQALERARDSQLAAHKAELEKLAEKKRDEDAILRWSHQNKKPRDP